MKHSYAELAALYRNALLHDVIPFWERNSIDWEYGGYFSCLDSEGNVYDTDKFMWLQARQMWTFGMLHNRLEQRESWLCIAKHGADFIAECGMDAQGNWYFSVDQKGHPLVQPYNIFSDCFAAMAFSQYGIASGEARAAEIALRTYENVLHRRPNPKGQWNKAYPGTRPLKTLAIPMILANLALEMEWLLGAERLEEALDATVNEVMTDFLDQERLLMFENVTPDGKQVDCFDGRLINPGHGIEAMWFMMDVARRKGDHALSHRAVDVVLSTLDFAWDDQYGGIYYFMDAQGHPPLQLEWDQKLWWVHLESLVALAMGYLLTGREACMEWYERVHAYAWPRFSDPTHGEWYGYLNRRGEVFLPLKGGKWKGCFHVPRAMYMCAQLFGDLASARHQITG